MRAISSVGLGLLLTVGTLACKKEEKAKEAEPVAAEATAEKKPETKPEEKPEEKPPAPAHPDSDVEMAAYNLADVKWGEAPMFPKGAMIAVLEGTPPFAEQRTFTVLAKFPKNYTIPPHMHPGVERVSVLNGEFSIGHGEKVDKKAAKKVAAGGVVLIPPEHPHFAFTTGAETVIMLTGVGPWGIAYIDPKDDPRQPPPEKVAAGDHKFDTPPADVVVIKAGDVKFEDPPPGMLPPGAQLATLEGSMAEPKTYVGRLKVPKGYRMPVHTHPTTERLSVISGTVKFGMADTFDEKAMKEYKPGAVLIMPKDHRHYFLAKSDVVIQANGVGPFAIVWANPDDDPAKALEGSKGAKDAKPEAKGAAKAAKPAEKGAKVKAGAEVKAGVDVKGAVDPEPE